MKKHLILVVILLIVVVSLLSIFITSSKKKEEVSYSVLSQKPPLSGKLIKNPDFVYPSVGWLSAENMPAGDIVLNRTEIDWEGNGFYDNETIGGRNGVVVIEPISIRVGRYIGQKVYLPPSKKYVLVVGLADIAGKVSYSQATGCDDVGFRVTVMDLDTGISEEIFSIILNSDEGWKDFSIPLGSKYSGRNIYLNIESYAGGPCGNWRGETAAVDYVDIIEETAAVD
jgi:hypothetical protein